MFIRLGVMFVALLMQAPWAAAAQDAGASVVPAEAVPATPPETSPPQAPEAAVPSNAPSSPPGPATLDAPERPAAARELALTRATVAELLRLEDEMNMLDAQRRRHRLTAPLVLMISGSATAALFGLITVIQASSVRDIESDIENGWYNDLNDVDADDDVDWDDHARASRAKRALLGATLVGLSVGIGGGVWFFSKLRKRRPLEA